MLPEGALCTGLLELIESVYISRGACISQQSPKILPYFANISILQKLSSESSC